MFRWLVSGAGEDLELGFKRAAEVYQEQAERRVDAMLHVALPVSLLFLGLMLIVQIFPLAQMVFNFSPFLSL